MEKPPICSHELMRRGVEWGIKVCTAKKYIFNSVSNLPELKVWNCADWKTYSQVSLLSGSSQNTIEKTATFEETNTVCLSSLQLI